MSELKPCPACGGEAESLITQDMMSDRIQDVVTFRCSNVICPIHWLRTNCINRSKAIEAWNDQPRIEHLEQQRDQLSQLVNDVSSYLSGDDYRTDEQEDIENRKQQILKGTIEFINEERVVGISVRFTRRNVLANHQATSTISTRSITPHREWINISGGAHEEGDINLYDIVLSAEVYDHMFKDE